MSPRHANNPIRTWLPALVMILSLGFQTGCKNSKTVINQAPAAPTTSTPATTTPTGTASVNPSDVPTSDALPPDDVVDPTALAAGAPNITINIINNGTINVAHGHGRRPPRRPPWWREGDDDLQLMGEDGGHSQEGIPDQDTDLKNGDEQECSAIATEDGKSPCDEPDPTETEPETNLVDLEANLKVARQAVVDSERLRDEAEAAAKLAGELADQIASVTDLKEAEELLAKVLEQSKLAGNRSEAVSEKVDAIGAGIDTVEASADQDGKEEALKEARSLWEKAEAASKATDEFQKQAEEAEARAQAKVDELSAAASAEPAAEEPPPADGEQPPADGEQPPADADQNEAD